MFIASPRHKLSPYSSQLLPIPEEDQKTEAEQKMASQSASATSQSVREASELVVTKVNQSVISEARQSVSKEAQDLGFWAVICDEEELKQALSVVKDVNVIVDPINQRTALHKIVEMVVNTEKEQQEQAACIALLLKCGVNIDQQDKWGNSPLHVAASYGNFACVKVLVSQGAAVDSRRFGTGWTPLYAAVMFSRLCCTANEVRLFCETIYWLITCGGADYSLKGGFDSVLKQDYIRTPLEAAHWDEVHDVIKEAIKARAAADEKKAAEALQAKVMKE
jgi:hypothetical protein